MILVILKYYIALCRMLNFFYTNAVDQLKALYLTIYTNIVKITEDCNNTPFVTN